MTTNSRNVTVGRPKIGGALYWAPLGTTVPTDETTDLPETFVPLGYVSTDGVTIGTSESWTDHYAWGGDNVHSSRTQVTKSGSVTLIETFSQPVNEFVFGKENVTATPATASTGNRLAIRDTGVILPEGVFVVDLADGTKIKRQVLPLVQPTKESMEETYRDSELVAYAMGLKVRKDEDGVYRYIYTDDGVTTSV